MTESEAKAILERDLNCLKQNKALPDSIEAMDMAINALEKQIAKEPIMKPYYEDMEEEYLCCPTCGDILTDRIPLDNKDFYFHCLNCGQKLNLESE